MQVTDDFHVQRVIGHGSCVVLGFHISEADKTRIRGGDLKSQERLREDALYKFMQFQWDVLTTVAMSKR